MFTALFVLDLVERLKTDFHATRLIDCRFVLEMNRVAREPIFEGFDRNGLKAACSCPLVSLPFSVAFCFIRITCPCDLYPLAPHFIVKLGFKGVYIFSSPESKAHRLAYSIPMLRRPSASSLSSLSSPLKPLGQSKPNFMCSLLGKGERKFV